MAAIVSRAWAMVSADAWLLLQRTIAATAAWLIAKRVFDHHEPFFAPIAAVIALNALLGERGSNAMRLLLGVGVGILVGELTVVVLSGGYGALALSTFVAMAIARALGGARVTISQAAASAILTVVSANDQAGTERLFDAVIGAGVALVFSQFLFSPEPIALLRRAESAALADISHGLELTARALERDDYESDERALNSVRNLRDRLVELTRLRRASSRVARHSIVWRSQMTPVVREKESADYLDLVGSSCLMLARTAIAVKPPERRTLAPSVRELSNVVDGLAKNLGDLQMRQGAADRALDIARRLGSSGIRSKPTLAAAQLTAQMLAADIMVFAGVSPDQAAGAIQASSGEPLVPLPPNTPRIPFLFNRRRPRR
ncbi:MAG TPA: FUSC family protein [Clostridia bacterium]|nr:FUSC family protein [Clostridia bacterium]